MAGYWYVLHTYSGHENKVKANLEERIRALGLEDEILEVLIPTQEVAELKDGKRRVTTRTYFPGYVLIKTARMLRPDQPDDAQLRVWQTIRDTPGVMSFVGAGKYPAPLSEEEVEAILRVSEGKEEKQPTPVLSYAVGDKVKVIDGPFAGFPGEVSAIDYEKQKLRLMISIFGRATPVELEFFQVERI